MTFDAFIDGLEVCDRFCIALELLSLCMDWRLLSKDCKGSLIFGIGFALSILFVFMMLFLNLSSFEVSLQHSIVG